MKKEELEEVWATKRVSDIAKQFETTEQAVYYWARKFGLPSRLVVCPTPEDNPKDPSPSEIKERAAYVRKFWTPEERARRMVGSRNADKRYTIPCYDSAVLFGKTEASRYSRI